MVCVASEKGLFLTFKNAGRRVQTLLKLHLCGVSTDQAMEIKHLPKLFSEFLGSKVVNERIKAAIQAAETERQFVGWIYGLLIVESQHTVSQQENVAGSKADGEDEENDGGQLYDFLFLGCLAISGQFAYNTNIAECGDNERQQEEEENHAEEEGCPVWQGWEHFPLEYIKACGNPKFRNVKGQVCGHQRVQSAQDAAPHNEADDESNWLPLPGLSELQGPDYTEVTVNSDDHHGQDGTVHIGVEDKGQETEKKERNRNERRSFTLYRTYRDSLYTMTK